MELGNVRRVFWRAIAVFLGLQAVAVASLWGWTELRKLRRAVGADPLPRTEARVQKLASGTTISIYTSGETLYEDMLAAIEAATEQVLLESYIIKADAMGERFAAALRRAASRGLDVRIVYDAFANLLVPPSFYRLGPGVKVLRYPLLARPRFGLGAIGRDHRKLLVIDHDAAFVGGYNIGQLYATEWRDTHIKVEGPGVWDLENAFVDFWNMHSPTHRMSEPRRPAWDAHFRVHRNVPRHLLFPVRGMYLEALDRAQHTIEITQAYFIPDRTILGALIEARRRGVQVRILLPKVSNHVVADFLARGHFSQLLEAGVEIWQVDHHMVHAKTATVDAEWSTVGTANIDRLSLDGNYEINIEIVDRGVAAQMSEIFAADIERSELLTASQWSSRPVVARVYEWILTPLKPLL